MIIHIKKAIALFFVFVFILRTDAFALEAPADISINDYTGSVSQSTIEYITKNNKKLLKQTGGKIIIVTVNTTDDTNISDYAQTIYNQWKIESIGNGNSVLLVIAKKDKDYKAIPCRNISGALTDNILDEYIINNFEPYFAKGDIDNGIISLYDAIFQWYASSYSLSDMPDNSPAVVTNETNSATDSSKVLTVIEKILFTAVVILIFLIALKHILRYIIKEELKKRKQKSEIFTHNDIDDLINELPEKPKTRKKFSLPKIKKQALEKENTLDTSHDIPIHIGEKSESEFAPITLDYNSNQHNNTDDNNGKNSAYSLGIDIEKEFEDINIDDIISKNTNETNR